MQQVGHLGRVVHPVGTRGGTGRVDHPVGAGQRTSVGDGASHGRGRAARRHQDDRLARSAQGTSGGDEGSAVDDVLGVDRDRSGVLMVDTDTIRSTTVRSAWLPSETNRETPSASVIQQCGEVEHQVAALAEHRHRAGRQQVVAQLQLCAGVDHPDAVRSDEHRARRLGQPHHLLLREGSGGAQLGEAGSDHDQGPCPRSDGVRDRLDELARGHAHHHEVERVTEALARLGERAIGTTPEHLGPPAVDQQHRPRRRWTPAPGD